MLCEQEFTQLFAEYKRLQRAEQDLLEDKQVLKAANTELIKENKQLQEEIVKLRRRPSTVTVINVALGSVLLGLLIGALAL